MGVSTHLILLFSNSFHSTTSTRTVPLHFCNNYNRVRTENSFIMQRKYTLREKKIPVLPVDDLIPSVARKTKRPAAKLNHEELSTSKKIRSKVQDKTSAAKVGNEKRDSNILNKLYASDVAKIAPTNPWVNLNISPQELRLSATLTNGQCFNWMVVYQDVDECNAPWTSDPLEKKSSTFQESTPSPSSSSPRSKKASAWGTFNETQWLGVFRMSHDPDRCLVLTLKETRSSSWYRILYMDPYSHESQQNETVAISELLYSYFQLQTKLAPLYEYWSTADVRLSRIAQVIPGVRILQQDPLECLFSFLCSSNNNIPRITKILADIRRTLGRKLLTIESHNTEIPSQTFSSSIDIYSFPTLSRWSTATEQSLRDLGLGYRAKYLIQSRDLLSQLGGEDYLLQLRRYNKNDGCHQYDSHVQDQLTLFSGVGKKVADCVALFSLDQTNAIPVDVHVQDIASRDYDASILPGKSLTPTVYKQVGDLFRTRFGNFAGWAHSLLFVAELPSFRNALPLDMIKEMDEWSKMEKEKKSAVKEKKRKEKEIN